MSSGAEFFAKSENEFLAEEFARIQAQRRKEKLAAAKHALQTSIEDIIFEAVPDSKSVSLRYMEVAADAIENLIRVIVEEGK